VKVQIISGALVIGLLGCAAPAGAQRGRGSSGEPESTPMGIQKTGANAGSNYEGFLYGVVKELTKDAMVLTKTQVGSDQTFKFNKKTKFIHDGKGSSLESVKLGDEVWVDADEDKKSGDLIARKVVTGVFVMK
jgi:hypothetical protein